MASEAALKVATDKVTAANQFKPQFDARVNAIKQANQPKDVNFSLISTPIKLRIVATPIAFTSAAVGGAVKQGEKQTLTANINRLYAFADAVEISFEPPAGVQGLTANKVSIPNGQAEGSWNCCRGQCHAKGTTTWSSGPRENSTTWTSPPSRMWWSRWKKSRSRAGSACLNHQK